MPNHDREQSREMRIVTGDQDVTRFAAKTIPNPLRGVVRLDIARRRAGRKRIAHAPERLGSLPGAKFTAMPHYQWTRAVGLRFSGEAFHIGPASFGERPPRIGVRPNRVAVMNEIDGQLSTLKSQVSEL